MRGAASVPLRYRSGAKNAWNALAQVWSAPIEEASRATTKRRDYNVKDVFGEFLLVFAFLEIHYSDRLTTLSKRKRGVGAAHCYRRPKRCRSDTEAARIAIEGPSGTEAAPRRCRAL